MNDRVPITRDFNLNFPIEEIKKSIEIVSTVSKATFKINNKNDIFNTYTMTLVGGITVINPNIQLIPVKTRKPRDPDKEPRVRGPNKPKNENINNNENLYPNLDDI